MRSQPSRFSLRVGALVMFSLLVGIGGCGGAETKIDRKPVSGTVSYEGTTDGTGSITFLPTKSGQSAITSIEGGRYEFSSGNGPPAGNYSVYIEIQNRAAQPNSQSNPKGGGGSAPVFLPRKSVDNITVPDASPFEIDIEV